MPVLSKGLMISIAAISLFVGIYAAFCEIGGNRISLLAAKILRGEAVHRATLEAALSTFGDHKRSCTTAHLTDSVIVRLKLFEDLSELLRIGEADLELTILSAEGRDLLSCLPTDSFIWLLQFWTNTISGSSDVANWKFLERSYEAGLYEGWVAARRSQIAVLSLDLAPEPLKNKAVQELKALLKYNFADDGLRLYASAPALAKIRLGEAVSMLDYAQRKSLARHLEPLTPSQLLINSHGDTNINLSGRSNLP